MLHRCAQFVVLLAFARTAGGQSSPKVCTAKLKSKDQVRARRPVAPRVKSAPSHSALSAASLRTRSHTLDTQNRIRMPSSSATCFQNNRAAYRRRTPR